MNREQTKEDFVVVAITQDRKERTLSVDFPDPRLKRSEYEQACGQKEFPCDVRAYVRVDSTLPDDAISAFRIVCVDGGEELREVLDCLITKVFEAGQIDVMKSST